MPTYKSGWYELQRGSDLFEQKPGELNYGGYIEIKLTEKEAKALFSNRLYLKLGFVGWSWLKE